MTTYQIRGAIDAVTYPSAQVTQLMRDDRAMAHARGVSDSALAGMGTAAPSDLR
jgi:hypothetical protein